MSVGFVISLTIYYFSPNDSLPFSNQKVTNRISIRYFPLRNLNECLVVNEKMLIFAPLTFKMI